MTEDGKSVSQSRGYTQTSFNLEKEKHSLRTDAQLNLINILSSIPQFWTVDDLVGLVVLVLEFPADTLELRKTLTKRVPSQQLLSALLRVWSRSVSFCCCLIILMPLTIILDPTSLQRNIL